MKLTLGELKRILSETESAVATNAVAGGAVEGIGIGPKGEPGFKKKALRAILKRNKESVTYK